MLHATGQGGQVVKVVKWSSGQGGQVVKVVKWSRWSSGQVVKVVKWSSGQGGQVAMCHATKALDSGSRCPILLKSTTTKLN